MTSLKTFYILHWVLQLEQKCNNNLNTHSSRHRSKRNSRFGCQESINFLTERVIDLYPISSYITYTPCKIQRRGWMKPTMDNIKLNKDSQRKWLLLRRLDLSFCDRCQKFVKAQHIFYMNAQILNGREDSIWLILPLSWLRKII